MEDFKKDLFSKIHKKPVDLQVVTSKDILLIKEYIETHLGSNKENVFFFALRDHLINNKPFDDLESTDGIKGALSELGFVDETEVIVIWDYPNPVDKFNLQYLVEYWKDIWFPQSDDAVCMYFPNIDRAIIITHWGVIYY
jgi:hypothetical protein